MEGQFRNCPATSGVIARGSTGCSTRSITPFAQTALGAGGAPDDRKHTANSESDFNSEP